MTGLRVIRAAEASGDTAQPAIVVDVDSL